MNPWAARGLDPGPMDLALESHAIHIEIEIAGLCLALFWRFAGEEAAKCLGVLFDDARNEACAFRKGLVFEDLSAMGERNDLLHRERFYVHYGQGRIDKRPLRVLARLYVINHCGDVSTVKPAGLANGLSSF